MLERQREQASSKPVPRKKKKKKSRQGGRRPGEPCRCDKLKISPAALGDAPAGCAAAGRLSRCRLPLPSPRVAISDTSSGFARAAQPLPLPRHTAGCRPAVPKAAPFHPHPLISSSRLAASSPPEILQLLGALAQIWEHGSGTKASGNRQPGPQPSPGGQLGRGGIGSVRVSGLKLKQEGNWSPMSSKIRGGFVLFNARPFWPM